MFVALCGLVACIASVVADPSRALVDEARLQRVVIATLAWGVVTTAGVVFYFHRRKVLGSTLVAMVLAVTLGVEWIAVPQWRLSSSVFVQAPVAQPELTHEVSARSGTSGRFNVLLLGGDAGPRRWGLRTDAMHLVSMDASLDPAKGVVVISIPRNLLFAPMPKAFAREFPKGFDQIVNELFQWGENHKVEVERALGKTDEPGASLVAAMVAKFTGLRVDGWVLTDMRGFIELVDAAGGVDVWVDKKIRAPGSAFGGLTPAHNFDVGWQRMDGADALSFSRARKQDSDYHRMARQRCVLASLAAQVTPGKLLVRWPLIAGAIARHVRTNLSPGTLLKLQAMTGLHSRNIKSLSLVPPYVHGGWWNASEVRALVRNALYGTLQPVVLPETGQTVTSAVTSLTTDPRWECKVDKSVG